MKQTYRIRARPHPYYGLLAPNAPSLSAQFFAEQLQGVIVHEILADGSGECVIDLELQRPTHEDALNEILVAIQHVGYSWLEARVTEWVSNELIGAAVGALGLGTAGAGFNDGSLTVVGAAIGIVAGALIGSFFAREKVVYQVHRASSGRWVLTPLPPHQRHPMQPGLLPT